MAVLLHPGKLITLRPNGCYPAHHSKETMFPLDDEGVAAIGDLFPDRATIGLPGDAVLAGGGGFHCASQQMPASD